MLTKKFETAKEKGDKLNNREWPIILCQDQCTRFGWDRVNVFDSSSHGAMFWTGDQNSTDNTPMFYLLLNSLRKVSIRSVSHADLRASKFGVHRKLRGHSQDS